jgi:hypothetical protein
MLAARVASMVSGAPGPEPQRTAEVLAMEEDDEPTVPNRRLSLGARLTDVRSAAGLAPEESLLKNEMRMRRPDPARFEVPTTNLAERAERVRQSATRFAGNSARARNGRRPDRETGISTRGNRNG